MTQVRSPEAVCARIAQRIEQSVGAHRYRMWFDQSARFSYEGENRRLDVAVPNDFVAEWIGRRFREEIRTAANGELGVDVDLAVRVDPQQFNASAAGRAQNASTTATAATAAPVTRRPALPRRDGALRHDLQQFVVGPSNELAYAAACRLADDDDAPGNPLFVHGGVGLGKTHLLQGICRRLLSRKPEARVLYTTGEQFTNEYVAAVREGKIEQYRKQIRRLDLLAIDDVHFLADKTKTQQEFLHSFDAIEQSGARVVLASDLHPRLIKQFSEALVSRCVRGLVVEVKSPDTATRLKIVRHLAERRGIPIMETVVSVLANRCQGSVREIEGTLTKLHAVAHLLDQGGETSKGDPIGHAVLNRLFESERVTRPRRAVRFETVVDVVASLLGVKVDDLLASGRQRPVVLARALVIHLARKLMGMSYPEIATAMKRSSHSTIITAASRIRQQIEDEGDLPLLLPTTGEETTLRALVDRLETRVLERS